MKRIVSLLTFILISIAFLNAQTIKIAILDFENTSGIVKYDGLGKAMSSMLISDIEANVSPKRLQLVERSQIQNILKEQNFQASSAVDKTTTVKAGKLLGVKYLLVGDIYILNDVLVINARLTDTETGDIKFSKKQEGRLNEWLTLKTNISKELAASISTPFTDPVIPDKDISIATLTTFGNAILAKDIGDNTLAEKLVETVNEYNPDFRYLDELKIELVEIKKRIEQNTKEIYILKENVETSIKDPMEISLKYLEDKKVDLAAKYLQISKIRLNIQDNQYKNKLLFIKFIESLILQEKHEFSNALRLQDSILREYPFFLKCRQEYIGNLIKLDSSLSRIQSELDFIEENDEIIQSKEFSYQSGFDHDYIGIGFRGKYVLSLGYGFIDWTNDLSFKLGLLSNMGRIYFEMGKYLHGEKWFNSGINLILTMQKRWSYNLPYFYNCVEESSFLTILSWSCAEYRRFEFGDKIITDLGFDLLSKDLMSVINFGHLYVLNKNVKKALDFYCWAIQNNVGQYTDVKEIILADLDTLKVPDKFIISCKY